LVSGNTFNADNELTASGTTSYTYDSDGNLKSAGTNTYSWNAQGELTAIAGGTTASFTYSPFGQRVTSTIGATSTSYLYDGSAWNSNVVQELSGTTPTENLLTGRPGQIFQLTTPGGTNSSYLTNPLGSTLALANAAATLTTNYSYTPSGAVTVTGSASPNNFDFNATQNDGTGLYLMGARYYNPASGTFVSQDPIGFNGGTTDLYGYAHDDPVTFNDPTGCGCSLSNLTPNKGKLLPPLDSYGSAIGGTLFTIGAAVLIGAAAASAFPILAAATVAIWALDGVLIGGLIGTACNLS
jgi:RHS repeat-associated protein